MSIDRIAILMANERREELEPQFPDDGVKFEYLLRPLFPHAAFRIFYLLDDDFPPSTGDHDAWIITGSVHSAYDGFSWIARLEELIRSLDADKRPLIGVCFGHQIIAKALGGNVAKSEKGAGLGIKEITFREDFPGVRSAGKTLQISHIHHDQVTELPARGRVISGNDFCPVSAFTIDNHILAIQGHPEFDSQFMQALLPLIHDRFPEKVYETGLHSLQRSNDGKTFARWMHQFLTASPSA